MTPKFERHGIVWCHWCHNTKEVASVDQTGVPNTPCASCMKEALAVLERDPVEELARELHVKDVSVLRYRVVTFDELTPYGKDGYLAMARFILENFTRKEGK